MVRITFHLLLVSLLWSCSASPEDKWYDDSADKSSAARVPLADSLAREVCTCMSTSMSEALGSSQFEILLSEMEKLVELPKEERDARAAEMNEKFAPLAKAVKAYEKQQAVAPPPCMTAVKTRVEALGESPESKQTGQAMVKLLNSNCRLLRLMFAWEGELPG